MKGKELEGRTYEPLFPYFARFKATGAFRVVCDEYVTASGGTGVVHQAPAFGEDDYRVGIANGVSIAWGNVQSYTFTYIYMHVVWG